MKFDQIRSELVALNSKIQELQSSVYVLMPIEDGFQIIGYFDMDTLEMGYTIVNEGMMEIKLISDLTTSAMIAYGDFVRKMEAWQNGDVEEFPFAPHSVSQTEIQKITGMFQYVPPDQNLDGDEGRLE